MQLLWIQVTLSIFVQDTKSIYQVEILTQGQIDLLDLKILLKHDYLFQGSQEEGFFCLREDALGRRDVNSLPAKDRLCSLIKLKLLLYIRKLILDLRVILA